MVSAITIVGISPHRCKASPRPSFFHGTKSPSSSMSGLLPRGFRLGSWWWLILCSGQQHRCTAPPCLVNCRVISVRRRRSSPPQTSPPRNPPESKLHAIVITPPKPSLTSCTSESHSGFVVDVLPYDCGRGDLVFHKHEESCILQVQNMDEWELKPETPTYKRLDKKLLSGCKIQRKKKPRISPKSWQFKYKSKQRMKMRINSQPMCIAVMNAERVDWLLKIKMRKYKKRKDWIYAEKTKGACFVSMDISDASVGILGQDGSIINKMVSLRKQEMGKLRNVALVGLEKASLQFKALLLELLCWSIEPRTGLMFQEYVHGLMTTRMEPQTLSWGREDSQVHLKFFYSEFMQFSLEDERFLVKHRWKSKTWPYVLELELLKLFKCHFLKEYGLAGVQRYSKEAMKNKNPLLEKINEKKLQTCVSHIWLHLNRIRDLVIRHGGLSTLEVLGQIHITMSQELQLLLYMEKLDVCTAVMMRSTLFLTNSVQAWIACGVLMVW
ncbi:hypothetical protein Bca101_018264 [Brassica carinata]